MEQLSSGCYSLEVDVLVVGWELLHEVDVLVVTWKLLEVHDSHLVAFGSTAKVLEVEEGGVLVVGSELLHESHLVAFSSATEVLEVRVAAHLVFVVFLKINYNN